MHYNARITALHGAKTIAAVTQRDPDGNHHLPAAGLFVMVGAAPKTGELVGSVDLDDKGCVLTDVSLATSCPGIFAVGDVRAGCVKRVASAVGEGSVVISKVCNHLAAK